MCVIGGDHEISSEQNSMQGNGNGHKVHNYLRSSKKMTKLSQDAMNSLHITKVKSRVTQDVAVTLFLPR